MNILLDTHTALWWINEYEKLSVKVKNILMDDANVLYISIVSAWEIAIKVSRGKMYDLKGGVKTFLDKLDLMPIKMLPITLRQIEVIESLPFIHSDPFDRMLIAAAKVEDMTLLTADENIFKYDVKAVW